MLVFVHDLADFRFSLSGCFLFGHALFGCHNSPPVPKYDIGDAQLERKLRANRMRLRNCATATKAERSSSAAVSESLALVQHLSRDTVERHHALRGAALDRLA